MILAFDNGVPQDNFEFLLDNTLTLLRDDSDRRPFYYPERKGSLLEEDVFEKMNEAARGTPFYGEIEHISGHKFPDIIARRYYGVEVKTTKYDHWTSTGNSILETTRVEDVERIYLLFGKLAQPANFRYKKYEECLYDVAVTHSPRYLIDMDTPHGETIFDKLGVSYDELRKMENPIKPIIQYYREIANQHGGDLWWLDSGEAEPPSSSVIISMWENIDRGTRQVLQNQIMALFPEVFGTSTRKYAKVAAWLASKHGIVSSSLRDRFSAGGKVDVMVNGVLYRIPRIFGHLDENAIAIARHVVNFDIEDLERSWEFVTIREERRLETWINLVHQFSRDTLADTGLDVRDLIEYHLN